MTTEFISAWLLFGTWCACVLGAIEGCCPRRPSSIQWRAIAIGVALLGVDAAVTRWLTLGVPPATLTRSLLAWLIAEVLLYWLHRAQHGISWLWRFHRVHHRARELTWAHAWHVQP